MLYFMPPAAPSGMAGAAAGAFVSTANFVITLGANTSYVQFEGLRIEHSRSTAVAQPAMPGDPNWWPTNPLAASAGGRLHNISFSACVIANAGGHGLSLDRCTGCSVHDSEVYGVGEAAIASHYEDLPFRAMELLFEQAAVSPNACLRGLPEDVLRLCEPHVERVGGLSHSDALIGLGVCVRCARPLALPGPPPTLPTETSRCAQGRPRRPPQRPLGDAPHGGIAPGTLCPTSPT